jgi:hypothetical protein
VPTSELTLTGTAVRVTANVLSMAHMDRLLDGELYAKGSRIEWATLLARTFDVDVKRCARCEGRLHVRAVVTDASTVRKLLTALRAPRAPPLAVA